MSQFNAPGYDIERPSGRCAFSGRVLEPGEHFVAVLVEFDPDQLPTDDDKPQVQSKSAADAQRPGKQDDAAKESAPPADPPAKDKRKKNATAEQLGFKRLDISDEAWDEGHRPDRIFSYWRTTVPEPNRKKKLFVDDAVLMNMLQRLADTDKPQRLAFRYVLALILMRKKLLRYDRAEKRTETITDDQGQPEQVKRTYWIMTPKLDIRKGPMSKWNEEETVVVLDPQLDEDQVRQVTGQLNEILEADFD